MLSWVCITASNLPAKRRKKITMKSLLSEAEKKEITVKNSAACVLNLMETLHLSYEDAVSALKIPAELQEAVQEEVRRLS
jgi:hypothetical protein